MVLLAVWFGAAVFFSLVVAPAAFAVLRLYGLPNTSEIAGAIVSRSLSVVNVAGFVIALLLAVTIFARRDSVSRKGFLTWANFAHPALFPRIVSRMKLARVVKIDAGDVFHRVGRDMHFGVGDFSFNHGLFVHSIALRLP